MNPKILNTLVLVILYLGIAASVWLMLLSIYEPPFLAFGFAALGLFIFVFYKAMKHREELNRK
jgi:hypothetical protein